MEIDKRKIEILVNRKFRIEVDFHLLGSLKKILVKFENSKFHIKHYSQVTPAFKALPAAEKALNTGKLNGNYFYTQGRF